MFRTVQGLLNKQQESQNIRFGTCKTINVCFHTGSEQLIGNNAHSKNDLFVDGHYFINTSHNDQIRFLAYLVLQNCVMLSCFSLSCDVRVTQYL